MPLTLNQGREWKTDGFFVVRGHFPIDTVRQIRERVNVVAERFYTMHQHGGKPPTQFLIEPEVLAGRTRPETALQAIRKIGNITACDETLRNIFGRHPASIELLRDLLPHEILAVMGALFAKPAHYGSETPWHQDQGLCVGLSTPDGGERLGAIGQVHP